MAEWWYRIWGDFSALTNWKKLIIALAFVALIFGIAMSVWD